MRDLEVINLIKPLKKYGTSFVFVLTKENMDVHGFEEGEIYELEIKKRITNGNSD